MDQDYQIMQLMAQRDDAPPPPTAAMSLAAAADQDVEQLLRGRQDVMYVVVLTKADKRSSQLRGTVAKVKEALAESGCDAATTPVLLTSANSRLGRDHMWRFLRVAADPASFEA